MIILGVWQLQLLFKKGMGILTDYSKATVYIKEGPNLIPGYPGPSQINIQFLAFTPYIYLL